MREGVAPLVLRTLADGPQDDLASARAMLLPITRDAGTRAQDAYEQLGTIVRLFRSRRIGAVVLKGAALARWTYRDDGLRPFTDLDLLVPAESINAVHQTLLEAGYASSRGIPGGTERKRRHGQVYYDPSWRRIPIDIHWQFLGSPFFFPIDYAGIAARSRPASLQDDAVLLLSPEDMLIALSLHFLREGWHGGPKLRYLRDIAEVARRYPIAPQRLLEIADQTPGLRCALYLILGASTQLLGAPVPDVIFDGLRPGRSPTVTQRLADRLVRQVFRKDRPAAALLQVALMRWLDRDGNLQQVRWLKEILIDTPRPITLRRLRLLRALWRGWPAEEQ